MEDEDAFDEEIDTLKFRLVLRPETTIDGPTNDSDGGNSATPHSNQNASSSGGAVGASVGVGSAAPTSVGGGAGIPLHRLMVQTVGGRSCSQVRFHLLAAGLLSWTGVAARRECVSCTRTSWRECAYSSIGGVYPVGCI